ncbi:ribonuclease H-like domain-containing protein [Tanacetum coccineum]
MAVGELSGSIELINNLDASNPLYLQSNDNSSLASVNVKHVGAENYKMWATAMNISLKGKNKMGFIDGTCVKQETSAFLSQQWESPERPNDEEGDSSNVKGNTWVTFDDCDNTVKDEVINVATQIGENVTFEGNVQTNQND